MNIALTNGGYMQIDEADLPLIERFSWHRENRGYARAYVEVVNGKTIYTWAHRLIIGDKPPLVCDHINRDRLDNRRSNLRHVTHTENTRNSGLYCSNKSGYRGVCQVKPDKWQAQIRIRERTIYLGWHGHPHDAARAYDAAALANFGAFAQLNFPRDAA